MARTVRRRMTRWTLLVPILLLAGCATANPADVPATADVTATATSEPPVSITPNVPPPTSSGKATAESTVVGVVEEGVERGCVMLRTADTLYQLVGSSSPLIQPGARLSVRGRPNPGLMTTCQQGTPFQVTAVQPG